MVHERGEDGRIEIEQLILSLSVVSAVTRPVDYSLTTFPPDEPGFHTINRDGGESRGSHSSICGLGPKHTHGGSAESTGEGW